MGRILIGSELRDLAAAMRAATIQVNFTPRSGDEMMLIRNGLPLAIDHTGIPDSLHGRRRIERSAGDKRHARGTVGKRHRRRRGITDVMEGFA